MGHPRRYCDSGGPSAPDRGAATGDSQTHPLASTLNQDADEELTSARRGWESRLVGLWQSLRASDRRIMDSRFGWLLPGGAALKLGQRAGRQGTRRDRFWLLLTGHPLDWWNYNVGRERGEAQRPSTDE